ncbi:MAG: PfkB family carbohydrate kinase [Verrucomicrobiota bacterium]
MSVLVVGSVGIDDVKTAEESHKDLLGGSASYAAVAASFFSPVNLVGVVGNDFPDAHRQLYTSKGVDINGLEVAAGETFRWSGEYEVDMNNRKTLSIALNVFETFQPKVPAAYRKSDIVLLANIAPALQSMVLDQMEKPRFVIADTMDLWINIARADLLALIKRVDMLILNDSEAKLLTGVTNTVVAGHEIQKMGPRYVAIKKGEHGCLLFGPDQLFAIPAFPLTRVPDPTGAGDCFAGGLAGYCAQQKTVDFQTLKEAVLRGTIVASYNVEAFSLKRLESLTASEIQSRLELYQRLTTI